MSSQSTRDRLRNYLVKHPSATAAQAGRDLGVTRQRIHAIAQAEGLKLGRASPAVTLWRQSLGLDVAAPRLGARVSTNVAGDPHDVAIHRVAADLIGRGFEIYVPSGSQSHELVVHDPGTGRFEGVSVELAREGKRNIRYDAPAATLLAIVAPDESIEYRPPLA